MWKYLLIALFLILAIREINLMNQSLYVTQDNKLVIQDKTTVSQLKKIITEIKTQEFLLHEPKTVHEKNTSVKTSMNSKKEPETNTTKQTIQTPKVKEKKQIVPKTKKHEKETNQNSYKSAEEKVKEILEQMKAQSY